MASALKQLTSWSTRWSDKHPHTTWWRRVTGVSREAWTKYHGAPRRTRRGETSEACRRGHPICNRSALGDRGTEGIPDRKRSREVAHSLLHDPSRKKLEDSLGETTACGVRMSDHSTLLSLLLPRFQRRENTPSMPGTGWSCPINRQDCILVLSFAVGADLPFWKHCPEIGFFTNKLNL